MVAHGLYVERFLALLFGLVNLIVGMASVVMAARGKAKGSVRRVDLRMRDGRRGLWSPQIWRYADRLFLAIRVRIA